MISQGRSWKEQLGKKGEAVKISGSFGIGPKGSPGIVMVGKGEGRLMVSSGVGARMIRVKSGKVVVLPLGSVLIMVTE